MCFIWELCAFGSLLPRVKLVISESENRKMQDLVPVAIVVGHTVGPSLVLTPVLALVLALVEAKKKSWTTNGVYVRLMWNAVYGMHITTYNYFTIMLLSHYALSYRYMYWFFPSVVPCTICCFTALRCGS